MKNIIPPIDKSILERELTEDKFVRNTNFGANKIYSITSQDSPNIMKEIGRLREYTFREAGGGTGKEVDIDHFDDMPEPYRQLLVWDPDHHEILGGYRYIICSDLSDDFDYSNLATSKLFHFSEKFKKSYLPNMIELGRSFVQPQFQSTKSRKMLFALDNLWDGLGALVVDNPSVKYFFGKVTMYTHFNQRARDYIIYFLEKYFGDQENLVYPKNPLKINLSEEELEALFCGNNYDENYRILSQSTRSLGENIPPLINSYMNLSPTMKMFGTANNPNFGNVEETGIMITIRDLYKTKVDRHVGSYRKEKNLV